MGLYVELGASLVFCSVILNAAQLCQSHLILNIKVSGRFVVKTGIRAYTVSSRIDRTSHVIITCSSRDTFPSKVSLWKDHEPINESFTFSANSLTYVKYYNKSTVNQLAGNYHCALNILTRASNNSNFEFFLWSEAEIRANRDIPLCTSSIGEVGYVGERAVLKCTKFYIDENCNWDEWSSNIHLSVLEKSLSRMSCTCIFPNGWVSTCSLPALSVSHLLHINLSYTYNDTSSDYHVMEFLCSTTPPRLMYWIVVGVDGNLLDMDDLNHSVKVHTSVNITQSTGETSLRIWEAIPGGNGIHTVMCYTYDTESRVDALVHIKSQPGTTSSYESSSLSPAYARVGTNDRLTIPFEGYENNSLSPTHDGVNTNINRATTLTTTKGGNLVIRSTKRVGYSEDFEAGPPERGYEMSSVCRHDYILICAIVTPLLVIILILTTTVFFMRNSLSRSQNETESKTDDSAQTSSSEIELHDNPAYLPFTKATESAIGVISKEKECTYCNL